MILQENKYSNIIGTYPDALLIDASGPGLTNGSELVALNQNDGFEPFQQALMDYAAGEVNTPAGTVGIPNGVSESAGASQMVDAIQKGNAVGPGIGVRWIKDDDPSVTGDRVLILSGQGVLKAVYQSLDAAVYVGDPDNATAEYYYHADDSAGISRNTAGIYLILGPQPPYVSRDYIGDGNDFSISWDITIGAYASDPRMSIEITNDGTITAHLHFVTSTMDTGGAVLTFDSGIDFAFTFESFNPTRYSGPATVTNNRGYVSSATQLVTISSDDDTTFNTSLKLGSYPDFFKGPDYQMGITY